MRSGRCEAVRYLTRARFPLEFREATRPMQHLLVRESANPASFYRSLSLPSGATIISRQSLGTSDYIAIVLNRSDRWNIERMSLWDRGNISVQLS